MSTRVTRVTTLQSMSSTPEHHPHNKNYVTVFSLIPRQRVVAIPSQSRRHPPSQHLTSMSTLLENKHLTDSFKAFRVRRRDSTLPDAENIPSDTENDSEERESVRSMISRLELHTRERDNARDITPKQETIMTKSSSIHINFSPKSKPQRTLLTRTNCENQNNLKTATKPKVPPKPEVKLDADSTKRFRDAVSTNCFSQVRHSNTKFGNTDRDIQENDSNAKLIHSLSTLLNNQYLSDSFAAFRSRRKSWLQTEKTPVRLDIPATYSGQFEKEKNNMNVYLENPSLTKAFQVFRIRRRNSDLTVASSDE